MLARLLSASGPTEGELYRPSDGAVPKKIFMLQCVGSRDCTSSGNEHCSAICCLFATLHASLLKQHYPEADPLLHERKVAAFLPDGDGDTVPSRVEGIAYPIHALQIAAMGMACSDSLQFEELVKLCESEKRWEFMVAAAPLRLPRGTGSLWNPIAIF